MHQALQCYSVLIVALVSNYIKQFCNSVFSVASHFNSWQVVDQKDIIVSEPAGLEIKAAFILLGGAVAFSAFYGFFLDPGAEP